MNQQGKAILDKTNLYIGNTPLGMTERGLQTLLVPYGQVIYYLMSSFLS